jgi:hypothetical protein
LSTRDCGIVEVSVLVRSVGVMTTTQLPAGPTGVDDAFGSVLAAVRGQLGDLVDTATWSLDPDRLDARIRDAVAARAAADQVLARLVAEADHRGTAGRHGAASTRTHLMTAYQMSAPEAARVLKTARVLNGPSAVSEPIRHALAGGQISAEQAVVVADAIARLSPTIDPDRIEEGQRSLLDQAARLSFTALRHAANHLVETIDPDGADTILGAALDAAEHRARCETSLHVQVHSDGSSHGRFRLGPAPTAILTKALQACAAPRRAGNSNNPLSDPTGQPVPYRTRLGLAFAELIEHLPVDKLPQHGVTNATIVVTVDEHKLRAGVGEATLDTGGSLSVGEVRRLACNAGILPIVLAGDSKILDLGTSQRLFDRYQRLALTIRDGGCVFPGCERPPAWCEAHHRQPWSLAGPTDLANGCLLCSFHHHLIHHGEWELQMAPDGIIEAIPPEHLDPHRRPLRHQRFKPRPG